MKLAKSFCLLFILFALAACSSKSESVDLYTPIDFVQLTTVSVEGTDDEALLPWMGPAYVQIINSVDDVYATQTELQKTDYIHPPKTVISVHF